MRFGIATLALGVGLYIAAGATQLGAYNGEPQPSWLTTLWLLATALVVVGLLVMVNVAVRVHRERM
ncbi:MAG TPA: hypothetical protein VE757_02300 [Gaiellaceae bacterium]|nr:hypothetical protein [Gaiellaceae bacterium]